MLEYIMTEGGKTPHEFLANPMTALARITPDIISKQDIDKMAITWAFKTGRCTSLAVKAAHDLAEKKVGGEPVYDWCIYDLNRHRVARCRKTGIARFDKTDARWKFKSSECKFESQGNAQGKVEHSSTPISRQAAMVQCLKEVGESAGDAIPTLFRTIKANGAPDFYGLVVWAPATHAIKLARSSEDWRAKKVAVIQWAQFKRTKAGKPTKELIPEMMVTEEDLGICLSKLTHWVENYGGPNNNGPTQWAADGISVFNSKLVQAAVNLWGYPKFIE